MVWRQATPREVWHRIDHPPTAGLRAHWKRWRATRSEPAAEPSWPTNTGRGPGVLHGATEPDGRRRPVVYKRHPYGRLERASSDLQLLLLVFLKHGAH